MIVIYLIILEILVGLLFVLIDSWLPFPDYGNRKIQNSIISIVTSNTDAYIGPNTIINTLLYTIRSDGYSSYVMYIIVSSLS